MALLSRRTKTPIAEAEREAAHLAAQLAALEEKLGEDRAAFTARLNEQGLAQLPCTLLNLGETQRLNTAVIAAREQVAARERAIYQKRSEIADAEVKLADLRAETERKEHAREIRAVASPLADMRAELAVVLRKAIDASRALADKLPVNPDFIPRLNSIIETIPAAIAELLETAERHAGNVGAGSAPPHRDPPPPQPEPVAPEIQRERVYVLAPIRWRELSGQIVCCSRFGFADLPISLLARALDANVVDRLDSPRTKKMIEGFGTCNGPGSPDQGIDLDAIEAPAAEQPQRTLPPGFQERVGPARVMEIAVNRT